jgi:glycosyltransferase involved in cell wall biosynthesis
MSLPEPLSPDARLPWEDGLKIMPVGDTMPGVSIVIPIYNSAHFLEKTLRSLMCNDLNGVELIVMDGGSKDGTAEILEHYRDIFTVCVSEPDRGQSDAINKGYARATKPILYWLNGDDIILPNTLVHVRRVFRDNADVDVVVGNAYMTEKDFTPIRHFVFSPDKLKFEYLLDYAAHHLVQPSVFFSRTAWDAAGPVKEEMHYAMDADLFLGMAKRYVFKYIPVDIGYSVYHEDCKTREKRAESITELAMVQAAHGGLEEARKTLNILVSLYNNAVDNPQPDPDTTPSVLMRKLEAVQAQAESNRQAVLNADLAATA